jgi:hypothetical protein
VWQPDGTISSTVVAQSHRHFRVRWRCHTHLSEEGLWSMLRDYAAAVDLFAMVPALALRFEPELAELD